MFQGGFPAVHLRGVLPQSPRDEINYFDGLHIRGLAHDKLRHVAVSAVRGVREFCGDACSQV